MNPEISRIRVMKMSYPTCCEKTNFEEWISWELYLHIRFEDYLEIVPLSRDWSRAREASGPQGMEIKHIHLRRE